jgi:phage gpG-like protein
MTTSLQWNADDILRRVVKAANAGVLLAAVKGQEYTITHFTEAGRYESSDPGSPPNVRRGKLRQSIVAVGPDQLGTPLHAAFGTNVKYGAYLEFGATVRPKNGRALPVPINAKAIRMLERLPAGGSLRSVKNLIIKKRPGLAPLLVEMTAGGKKGTNKKEKSNGAVFILKSSFTIRPRPWLRPALRNAAPAMVAEFNETFGREMGFKK